MFASSAQARKACRASCEEYKDLKAAVAGLLYGYGDVPALTAALRRLLGDALLRRAMGEAGRRRVVEGFSIDTYVAGVARVLEEALA